jgi:hypothetical protein
MWQSSFIIVVQLYIAGVLIYVVHCEWIMPSNQHMGYCSNEE